eukprot:3167170-Rhodomonas_salina.1
MSKLIVSRGTGICWGSTNKWSVSESPADPERLSSDGWHVNACASSEQEVESCQMRWEKAAAETCPSTNAKAKAAELCSAWYSSVPMFAQPL